LQPVFQMVVAAAFRRSASNRAALPVDPPVLLPLPRQPDGVAWPTEAWPHADDFARFGYLYLRDGVWDGERILPAGWVDYARAPTPQSDGIYGAHFWIIPGSLGLFYCSGAFGQRILISPKLDLVIVRLGNTAAHSGGSVVRYCKDLIDLFRPTAGH